MKYRYVMQEVFDERTNNIIQSLCELKIDSKRLHEKVDNLNNWKVKVVTGSSVIAGIIAIIWQFVSKLF